MNGQVRFPNRDRAEPLLKGDGDMTIHNEVSSKIQDNPNNDYITNRKLSTHPASITVENASIPSYNHANPDQSTQVIGTLLEENADDTRLLTFSTEELKCVELFGILTTLIMRYVDRDLQHNQV